MGLEGRAAESIVTVRGSANLVDQPGIELEAEELPVSELSRALVGSQSTVERVKFHYSAGLALSVGSIAGPRILRQMFNHVRANWIELDVAIAAKEVVFFLRQARLETSLPERAATAVVPIDVLNVALPESFHHLARTGRCSRCREQVDMVRHQPIGVDGTLALLGVLVEPAEVRLIVLIGVETGLAVVAPLDDV